MGTWTGSTSCSGAGLPTDDDRLGKVGREPGCWVARPFSLGTTARHIGKYCRTSCVHSRSNGQRPNVYSRSKGDGQRPNCAKEAGDGQRPNVFQKGGRRAETQRVAEELRAKTQRTADVLRKELRDLGVDEAGSRSDSVCFFRRGWAGGRDDDVAPSSGGGVGGRKNAREAHDALTQETH